METKVTKRLESNKLRAAFKDAPTELLLPMSLGSSSISLLHILDQQLQYLKGRTGRSSFEIHVLFVDQSAAAQQHDYEKMWRFLKARFPSHSYSVARLEDVFDYDADLESDSLASSISITMGQATSKNRRIESFLSSLPSATSRADMISILRSRLIISLAKERGCSSIIYGDSTTRLAERTLSETAKGRGGSIPWLTADGHSPHGIKIVYPMRDLLRKEIAAYASVVNPPLTPLVLGNSSTDVVTSSKHTTIEDLMGQYFDSVEQNYPSIVSNVVRTSSRLVAPSTGTETGRVCSICQLPLAEGTEGLCWSGEQERPNGLTHSATAVSPSSLCYGCARSTLNPSQVTTLP